MINFKALGKNGELINSALSPFTFPAGEAHTKREDRRELERIEIAIVQFEQGSIHDDLFQIAMWNDYLTEEPVLRVLVMPYVPGARADRGNPFGARVYTDFINSMDLDYIVVFDVHSPVAEELLLDSGAEVLFYNSEDVVGGRLNEFSEYTGIIAPDKGAVIRAESFAKELGLPTYTVNKTRDFETGKLLGFEVPELDPEGKYLIVDDICDGGGTFNGIAEALDLLKEQLDLYVSHGVFSKGTNTLLENFGKIYTTNSFLGDLEGVAALDVVRPMIDMIR